MVVPGAISRSELQFYSKNERFHMKSMFIPFLTYFCSSGQRSARAFAGPHEAMKGFKTCERRLTHLLHSGIRSRPSPATASIGNMAPRLSDFEKGQIDALHRLCLTPRAIVARLRPRPDKTRPSYKTVERFLKNRGKTRVFKKPGPARTISPKLERRLIRHVITDRLTSAQAVTELQLACSARTVRRILQRSPEVRIIAQRRKFFISEKNRVKRLAFAREYVHKPLSVWKNVIFSDEKDLSAGRAARVQQDLSANARP
ncbi:hypothetical protein FVE85_8660 [Porphyridium purpureum]|uniref:Transposase Tc1-like domain-containing protein n=1 Tax=Porphyridium purpureum TaxID=35688 RepID=A0A5J4YPT4_PORPP|nr:hypothetical protein FVE85_8660 [Porphyridium purpureum]|eukprot:POR8743..scf296_7